MSGPQVPQGRERPDEETQIAAALLAEAEHYQPDLTRIQARLRAGQFEHTGRSTPSARSERPSRCGPAGRSGSPSRSRSPSRSGQVGRRSGWVPVAAAALVVITAGAITAIQRSGRPPAPERAVQIASAPGPAAGPATALPTVTRSPSGAPPSGAVPSAAPTSGPAVPGPPRSPSTAPSARRTSPAPAASGAPVQVQVAAAAAGQPVLLPGGGLDWIAADPGDAVQTIRREHGQQLISGPHLSGDPTPSITAGPFAVSWSGGMPQQRASASRRWLRVSGPAGGPETGLIIRVPAHRTSGELVLYVGAVGTDAHLQAQLEGDDRAGPQLLTLPAGAGTGGYTVRIRFHTSEGVAATGTSGSEPTLSVRLIAGDGGAVAFAAATLH